MKFWGAVVVLLYVVILFVLSGPLCGFLFFSPEKGWPDFLTGMNSAYMEYSHKGVWFFLAAVLIAQSALLSVPVEMASNRPVTKRTIIPLVIATSFTTGILFAGGVLAISEVFKQYPFENKWMFLAVFFFVWIFWAIVFYRFSKNIEPRSFIERQCQWIYKGSILELLIAVPAHIYVRQRHDCCAGFETGFGIAFGVAVMLFSFGPGIFYLLIARINAKNKGSRESVV